MWVIVIVRRLVLSQYPRIHNRPLNNLGGLQYLMRGQDILISSESAEQLAAKLGDIMSPFLRFHESENFL